jgi:hypothetical protein
MFAGRVGRPGPLSPNEGVGPGVWRAERAAHATRTQLVWTDRERYLTDPELFQLGPASAELSRPFDAIREGPVPDGKHRTETGRRLPPIPIPLIRCIERGQSGSQRWVLCRPVYRAGSDASTDRLQGRPPGPAATVVSLPVPIAGFAAQDKPVQGLSLGAVNSLC